MAYIRLCEAICCIIQFGYVARLSYMARLYLGHITHLGRLPMAAIYISCGCCHGSSSASFRNLILICAHSEDSEDSVIAGCFWSGRIGRPKNPACHSRLFWDWPHWPIQELSLSQQAVLAIGPPPWLPLAPPSSPWLLLAPPSSP